MRRYDLTNNKKWQRQVQWKRQKTITIEEHPQRTILRAVTFETLKTFLTIENNNLNIHTDPWIKSDRDSIRNSCDVFCIFLQVKKLKNTEVLPPSTFPPSEINNLDQTIHWLRLTYHNKLCPENKEGNDITRIQVVLRAPSSCFTSGFGSSTLS